MTHERPAEPTTEEMETVAIPDRLPIWREVISLVRQLRPLDVENLIRNGNWGGM